MIGIRHNDIILGNIPIDLSSIVMELKSIVVDLSIMVESRREKMLQNQQALCPSEKTFSKTEVDLLWEKLSQGVESIKNSRNNTKQHTTELSIHPRQETLLQINSIQNKQQSVTRSIMIMLQASFVISFLLVSLNVSELKAQFLRGDGLQWGIFPLGFMAVTFDPGGHINWAWE